MSSLCILSPYEQEKLIEKLNIFKIQGVDKRGHKLIRIIGNLFPARLVSVEVLNKYLKEKVFPSLSDFSSDHEQQQQQQLKPFSVVYMHTGVCWSDNFPGLLAVRLIYEAIPVNLKNSLQTIYFLHPDLQSRLFLATFGRLLFTRGLYWKVKYLSRLQYLWKDIRRKEIEIPEFVAEHDKQKDKLYILPLADNYSWERDYRFSCGATANYMDSP